MQTEWCNPASPVKWTKSYFHGAITSLFLSSSDQLAFAATGPFLEVYQLESGALLFKQLVLNGSVIHGIRHRNETLSTLSKEPHTWSGALFGQKRVALLKLIAQSHFEVDELPILADWILDIAFCPPPFLPTINHQQNETAFLLVGLAHNFVQVWSTTAKTLLLEVKCPIVSLLYSMSFFPSERDVLVACGTVFNDVFIWSLKAHGEIRRTLKGHQGVVFGLCWSKTGHDLCSVSDDRSVRVWKNAGLSTEVPVTCSGPFFGHSARCWRCLLLPSAHVISTSEDGRCRVWDSSLGTCLTSLVGHQGKNVWAIATDEEGRILASGGGDGAILLWDLEKEVADQERNTRRWTTKLPPRKQQQGKEKETIRCLKFDSLGKLLAVTNLGSLWQFDGESEQWHPLAHDLLQSYHRMELLTAENVLALASLRGAITLISLDGSFKTTTWTAHARSVLGVFFISGFPHAGPNDLWFCSSGHEGSLCLWKATVLDRQAELTITKIADYTLAVEGKVQGRGENSIAVVSVARHPRSSAVVCGDGYGSLHVFPVPALPVTDRALPALTVAPHAHGNEAVVAVLVDGEGVVLSLSRDGVLNRFLWVEHPDGNGVGVVVALQRITSDRLHKEVEIAERLIVMGTSVFAMAFSGGDMSVYATTHGHKKIFSGKCGSFKRIHDLALTDAFESAAFVEGNTVHIQRTSTPPKRFQLATLREHAHGLQTNAVRLFQLEHRVAAVTASDDCSLLVREFGLQPVQPRQSLRLEGHTSGVRSVCTSPCSQETSDTTTFLFSGGGKGEWKGWKVGWRNGKLFHERLASVGKALRSDDEECRVMDIVAFPVRTESDEEKDEKEGGNRKVSARSLHCVAVGRSDRKIKVYIFDENKQECIRLAAGSYHQGAVISLHLIHAAQRWILVSGSTDGTVAFADLTPALRRHLLHEEAADAALTPIASLLVHQAGVNSIASCLTPHGILLFTGGDDGILTATALRLSVKRQEEPAAVEVGEPPVALQAHNSSITAIALSRDWLFSTSPDQRLHAWKLTPANASRPFALAASVLLEVGDVSDIDVFATDDSTWTIAVVGYGTQILQFFPLK